MRQTKYHGDRGDSAREHASGEPMNSIPRHVATHVLWFFGGAGGVQPGSFIEALLDLVARADPVNTQLLRGAYPEYVHAFCLAQSKGGIGQLLTIANGDGNGDDD